MRTIRQTVVCVAALALPLLGAAAEVPMVAAKGAGAAPWVELPGLPAGCDGVVRALLPLADGRIAIGGSFSACGGVPAANIALWQPTTGTFAALGAGVGAGEAPVIPAVSALARIGDGLFIGGSFAEAGGVAVRNIVRHDLVTGAWTPLGSAPADGVGGEVLALAAQGTSLFVGGDFSDTAGTTARHFARFDAAGGAWVALSARPDGPVRALAVAGTGVFVGGDFSSAGTASSARIARFDGGSGAWSPLGTGVDGRVHALAVRGDTVFVGGAFRSAGGVAAHLLAAYATTSGTWSALARGGQGLEGGSLFLRSVRALAVAEGELLASGDFTVADRGLARYIARVDVRTGAWNPLGSGDAEGMDGPGLAIAVSDRQAIVGGGFRRAGGAARSGLAVVSAPEGLFADGFEAVP
jgi:hypothetical protein